MKWATTLSTLDKNSVVIAGGKGASLGEMIKAGIPVPPGFVILSSAFEHFLRHGNIHEKIDAILHTVDHQKMHTVEDASEQIKAIILSTKMPKNVEQEILKAFTALNTPYVAVRSSATAEDSSTAAWAGQLESYLNMTKKTLLENVKKCWASLFTPRAIFYRFEKNLHEQHVGVAVVVQKMVQSEVAGIAFSVHPVTQDRNQLIIEAGFGLGEAIVSGQITPDSYVVEKKKGDIIEKNVARQENGLYRVAAGGNIWKNIPNGDKQKLTNNQIIELSTLLVKIERHYGFPVDVEWTFEGGKFYIVQSRPITTLAPKTAEKESERQLLRKEEYLKTVKRPYPPLFTSLVCMGYPKTEYFQEVLKKPYAFPNMAHVDSIWYYAKKEVEEGGGIALESWKDKNFFENVKKIFKKREDELIAAAKKDIKSYCNAYMKYMPPLALVFAVEKPTETRLRDALSKKLSAEKVDELMSELNIPLQDNFYKKEEYDLVMAKDLAKHVKKYGWILARYGEERKYTIEEAQEKLKPIKKVEFLKKWKEDKQKLKKVITHAKDLMGRESYLVDIFQYIIFYRTQRTDIMNKSAFLAIPMLKKLAESLGLTYKELLYCSASELLEPKIPSKEILKRRMEDCSTILYNGSLRVVTGEESAQLKEFFKEEVLEVKEIKGSIACKGNVKGQAKVVLGKEDFGKVLVGDVLVTSMTTPEMMPFLKRVVAFVTDEGGVTCHAAIVSREMKKPCIIGTKIATKVLKDGDWVEVDANRGVVRIVTKK